MRFPHRFDWRAISMATAIMIAATGYLASKALLSAQDAAGDPNTTASSGGDVGAQDRSARRHLRRKAARQDQAAKTAAGQNAESTVAARTTDDPAPGTSAAPTYTAQLEKAGAAACAGQVNTLARSTMRSVVEFNTVANWSQVAGEKRAVGLAIGQKYAGGSAVPFSLSQVFSAPNQQGGCDGMALQIFPSPLSCARLRDTIAAAHGRQIGDLAGIPLMLDGGQRTMLVPTAANTCVLVATRSMYDK